MRKALVAQRAAAAIAGGEDEAGTPGTPATPLTPSAAAAHAPPPQPPADPRLASADPRLAAADPRLRGQSSDPRLAAAGAAAGAAAAAKRTAAAAGVEGGGGESEYKMQRTPSVLPDLTPGDGAADSPDVEAHRAVSAGSNAPPPGRGKIKLTLASG